MKWHWKTVLGYMVYIDKHGDQIVRGSLFHGGRSQENKQLECMINLSGSKRMSVLSLVAKFHKRDEHGRLTMSSMKILCM